MSRQHWPRCWRNKRTLSGKLFNKPTANGVPGVDVYEGCKPSYTGKQVNSKNFEAVLTGDSATATGPVLQSTSKDKVCLQTVGKHVQGEVR